MTSPRTVDPIEEAKSPEPRAQEATRDDEEETHGLRFEDPYWDDAFCAWWDPTLRTCC